MGAISLFRYDIEQIALDHPALVTASFEACAVARCRQSGSSPWPFTVDCRSLPKNGTRTETIDLAWGSATERDADKAEKTYLLGDISYLAFLDFKQQLLDARLREAEAKASIRKAEAQLRYSVGFQPSVQE